ncbi:MAG TPA: pepsin/retropepsin-like aspartic protease family protein [Pyrinomonadaceae bacterium]|jgi:Aspartyl protease
MRARLFIALGALAAMGWAVPSAGTAPFIVEAAAREVYRTAPLPLPVRLRINRERGLLVSTWINGRGPYLFAVDTGAGLNIITQRVVDDAHLPTRSALPTIMGGLTGARTTSNREAVINQLALGDRANVVPATKIGLVVPILTSGLDGVLDPTDIYSPYGYSIDMPNQRIEAIDTISRDTKPERANQSGEGAIVPWLRLGNGVRPFVRLGDGRLALIDTGSGFGLAVNARNAVVVGNRRNNRPSESTRDIAGGAIHSRRVSPTTISIGELVLQRVPTDILYGVEDDAPVILGRDVLHPFKITFDPQRRLIEIVTSERP